MDSPCRIFCFYFICHSYLSPRIVQLGVSSWWFRRDNSTNFHHHRRSYRILFITLRIRKRAAMSCTKWLSNIPRCRRKRFREEVRVSGNSSATCWRCSVRWIRCHFNHTMAGSRGDFIHRFHCDFYCSKKILGNQYWVSQHGCKWLGTNKHAANSSRHR